jgi:D-sedoheptulose 7-phosphate isomerase
MAFLISTSGNSANLLIAADTARRQGIHSVGLLGKGGGELAARVDEAFIVPSQTTARIQEAHIFFGHFLCEQIERYLGLA